MSATVSVDVIRWAEIDIAILVTFLVACFVSLILNVLLKKTSFSVETGNRIVRIARYGINAIGTI
jgi:hypothetical protein